MDFIHEYEIIGSGASAYVTRENVFMFSADSQNMSTLSVEDIGVFIEEAYCVFNKALAQADSSMCFYAWFDWQSSTLRCCASYAKDRGDLPFGAEFEITSDACVVAALFKYNKCIDGIPIFEESENFEEDDFDDVLVIFSKMICR